MLEAAIWVKDKILFDNLRKEKNIVWSLFSAARFGVGGGITRGAKRAAMFVQSGVNFAHWQKY